MIEKQEFDSTFFGFTIGKSFDSFSKEESGEYDLVYAIAKEDDTVLQNHYSSLGGRLVDNKVLLSLNLDLRNKVEIPTQVKRKVSCENDENFFDVVIQSGIDSRFKVDPLFPNELFEKLYRKWGAESFGGQMGDEVFIYEIDSKIAGLVTLKFLNKTVKVSLIAVDSKFRNKGIGASLINKVIDRGMEKGFESIDVITQADNEVAMKFYKGCGFEVQSVEKIYHYWSKK